MPIDDRRWALQTPIFKRGCCQEGSKRIACELPNAESRSLRRFGEGPNTDKISSLLNSIVSGATLIFTLVASAPASVGFHKLGHFVNLPQVTSRLCMALGGDIEKTHEALRKMVLDLENID